MLNCISGHLYNYVQKSNITMEVTSFNLFIPLGGCSVSYESSFLLRPLLRTAGTIFLRSSGPAFP